MRASTSSGAPCLLDDCFSAHTPTATATAYQPPLDCSCGIALCEVVLDAMLGVHGSDRAWSIITRRISVYCWCVSTSTVP